MLKQNSEYGKNDVFAYVVFLSLKEYTISDLPLRPLFQGEGVCETFHMKISSLANKTHFHIKAGFALDLALEQRQNATRKWPIMVVILKMKP